MRRHIAGTFIGAIALASLMATSAEAETRRPNVVFFLVDDLGYGDLGYMGADDMRTPHIDRLAASGMTFTNFYANCPVCSPTRAALLTGRYQDLVGVPGVIRTHPHNNWGYLRPEAVLLPVPLARVGYHTAMVGKWHLGLLDRHHPTRFGYADFYGFRSGGTRPKDAVLEVAMGVLLMVHLGRSIQLRSL